MFWFEQQFLPSIEKKYNERHGRLWLTPKQVEICRDYFRCGKVRENMYYDIGEKRYVLQVSPSGAARLSILRNGWIVQHT